MRILLALYNKIVRISPLKKLADTIIKLIVPKTIKIEEGTMLLNTQDPNMSGQLTFGTFEPMTTKVFRRHVTEGMIVVDIGANIGYYSVVAGTRVGTEGKVIAYEPEEINYSFLLKNIRANNLRNTIGIKSAITNRNGYINLCLSDDNMCTHSIVPNRPSSATVRVITETLDDSLADMDIRKVDLIKMDIEGSEILALEGMRNTISNNPNIIIISEFYPKAIKRLNRKPIDFLTSLKYLGLSLWIINEDKKYLEKLNPAQFEKFVNEFPDNESVTNLYASRVAPKVGLSQSIL